MKKIFSKDECAPDAQTLDEFQVESGIGLEVDYYKPFIRVDYSDWACKYYVDTKGNYLKDFYSCGVYEDFYQFDNEQEYQADMKHTLLVYCSMGFLKE